MTNVTYKSVGEFGSDFPPRMAGMLVRFERALIDEATTYMAAHSAREPVGSGRRYKGDKQPGALKASRKVTRGATSGSITWDAPHALVINLGRKRSKPYSRAVRPLLASQARGRRGQLLGEHGTKPFTRMLGSKLARGGMTRPAFRALRRDWGQVIEKAATKIGEAA